MSSDLRDLVAAEASSFLDRELAERREDWRRTLASVTETLRGVEQECEAVIKKTPDESALSALVDKLTAVATAKVEGAVSEVSERAQKEIDEITETVKRLESQLQAERDRASAALASVE